MPNDVKSCIILEEVKVNKEKQDNKCKECKSDLTTQIKHDFTCVHYLPTVNHTFLTRNIYNPYVSYYVRTPEIVSVGYTPYLLNSIEKDYLVKSSKNKDFWSGYFSTIERFLSE